MDVYEGIMAGLEDALAYEQGEPNGCVAHRRQKISKSKPPKKAKHKHVYHPCILEYNGCRITKEHGATWDRPDVGMGSYCTICGKLGDVDVDRWWRWEQVMPGAGRSVLTEEAERELNPDTRTLPTFWVEDRFSQKYINLPVTEGNDEKSSD